LQTANIKLQNEKWMVFSEKFEFYTLQFSFGHEILRFLSKTLS